MTTRKIILFALVAGFIFTNRAIASGPDAVTDLAVTASQSNGAIDLTFTNPPNGADHYAVRINYLNAITNQTEWINSFDISDPNGLQAYLPAAGTAGTTYNYTIRGLTGGVQYYVAVKAFNSSGAASPLSTTSPSAIATQSCSAQPGDGGGSSSIIPSAIITGTTTVVSITYVGGAAGIAMGGKISVQVPDWMPAPQNSDSQAPGYVDHTVLTGNATFTTGIEGRTIILTVDSNSVAPGDQIKISYAAYTCVVGPNVFRVFSQAAQCGQLKPVAPALVVTATAGQPGNIRLDSYETITRTNVTIPLTFYVTDWCGNPVNTLTSVPLQIEARINTGSNITPDPVASLSLMNDMSNSSTTINTLIPGGTNYHTVYYRITSESQKPHNEIMWRFIDFRDGINSVMNVSPVTPTSTNITNAKVSNGTSAGTNVTFTPDQDGIDDSVTISYDLAETLFSHISIMQGTTTVRDFSDYRDQVVFNWDGGIFSPDGGYVTAPPGVYTIHIELSGGHIVDNSLSVTLSANAASGLVRNAGTLAPIPNADVSFYGARSYFTRTKADGTFLLNGIAAGSYSLAVMKSGHSSYSGNVTISAGNNNLGAIGLTKQSVLRISCTRPTAPLLGQIWGMVRAHTANWSQYSNATIHFPAGQLTSGGGDTYNPEGETPYTELALAPNVAYIVEFDVPYHGASSLSVTLNPDETRPQSVVMTRKAVIEGLVSLPVETPSANPYGRWVSVQAQDVSNAVNQRQGGAWIPPNELQGRYLITGLNNGTYALRASVQEFVDATRSVTIAGNADALGTDFATFDRGGKITATLNFTGDTGFLDNNSDGYFEIPLNAWNPSTNSGSFTQIAVATNPTSSSITTDMKGLADGTYQVSAYVQGFERAGGLNGPINVTVSGGIGTVTINFTRHSGVLQVPITLPGGQTDYANVQIDLRSFDGGFGGPAPTPTLSGNIYTYNNLGTGLYTLRAKYLPTGFIKETGVRVSNGSTATMALNLAGTTYSISGHVASTSNGFPLNYIINSGTSSFYFGIDTNGFVPVIAPANHILVRKIDSSAFNMFAGAIGNGVTMPLPYIDVRTSTYTVYDDSGTYTLTNVSPGTYLVSVNSYIGGDFAGLPDVAPDSQIINIIDANKSNINFTINDGFTVSGSLTTENSESSRQFYVYLRDSQQNTVSSQEVTLVGTSVNFSLGHVPTGRYMLLVEDNGFPLRYSAESTSIEVNNANVSSLNLTIKNAGHIRGQLQVADTGVIITPANKAQYLPSGNFSIDAVADPWEQGKYYQADYQNPINNDGYFDIPVGAGTFRVRLNFFGFGEDDAASGRVAFVGVEKAGVVVQAGVTKDIGILSLIRGKDLSGLITDVDGNPLSNVLVTARASRNHFLPSVEAYSNASGRYVLHGLDGTKQRFYDIIAAPRPDGKGDRYFQSARVTDYVENRRVAVDLKTITTLNFTMKPATASLKLKVVTPDGGPLLLTFEENGVSRAGAEVILNESLQTLAKSGADNPLGEISAQTEPDGTCVIQGLKSGKYRRLYVMAKNYGSQHVDDIELVDGVNDIGTVTLKSGNQLSGLITKNGESVTTIVLRQVIAISKGFQELAMGSLETDASGTIISYRIDGLQTNTAYTILGFSENDEMFSLGSGTFNVDTTKNLTIEPSAPQAFTQLSKQTDGTVRAKFFFTSPLVSSEIDSDNNGTADTDQASLHLTLTSGNGTLDTTDWLSSNREEVNVTYTPAANETEFALRLNVTFNATDVGGSNYTNTNTYIFKTGLAELMVESIDNSSGGTINMQGDTSQVTFAQGVFGDDETYSGEVTFQTADDNTTAAAESPHGSSVLAVAQKLGMKSYPQEMAVAMNKAIALDINPFSSFYSILLPAGVNHFFPEGKDMQLCLAYDAATTDPASLNIYYFNSVTNEYTLESTGKTVDTDNHRICADIGHASVFTLLNSSNPIIGASGYTGELAIMNFPNPFSLKTKSITLQDPGATTNASQNVKGTMIKISVPGDLSGNAEIEIYNVAGEKVRTIATNIPNPGAHYYVEWDGTNDRGNNVASGTYIARFTIGGGHQKFFKMSVVK